MNILYNILYIFYLYTFRSFPIHALLYNLMNKQAWIFILYPSLFTAQEPSVPCLHHGSLLTSLWKFIEIDSFHWFSLCIFWDIYSTQRSINEATYRLGISLNAGFLKLTLAPILIEYFGIFCLLCATYRLGTCWNINSKSGWNLVESCFL